MGKSVAALILVLGCSANDPAATSTCGNGKIEFGEDCDGGPNCSPTCHTINPCGNGTVDPGEDCDDGNTTSGDGCSATCKSELAAHTLTASWILRTLEDPTALPCPPAFGRGIVTTQIVDPTTHVPIPNKPAVDTEFTCAAGTGVTTALPGGVYLVTFEIKSMAATYATSLPQIIDIRTTDKPFSAVIYKDAGYFNFKWTLVDGANAPVSCADAGAGSQGQVIITFTDAQMVDTTVMDLCGKGSLFTDPLVAGAYNVAAIATNNNPDPTMGTIGTADAVMGAVINVPNLVTDVPLNIPIDGL
jgi:cysteine-rich repeat protein